MVDTQPIIIKKPLIVDEDEDDDNILIGDYRTYLDMAIKKVNRASRRPLLSSRNHVADKSQIINHNKMLASLVIAAHRDCLGRRNSVCSTDPKTGQVVKQTIQQMIVAKKLALYGLS